MNLLDSCNGHMLGSGLAWLNAPPIWSIESGILTVSPLAETDFFRPSDGLRRDNAGLLYMMVEGDFIAEASVSTTPREWGDAGGLSVRSSEQKWFKLCVEQNRVGTVSIISVVTDPWSDDADGAVLPSPQAHLQVSRAGNVFAMHYRLPDQEEWTFVRKFTCEMPDEVMVGVHAQAPFQAGCTASFSRLKIDPE